jgi:cell wall-active antibiotic response 4TMS protein YvqF
VADEPPEPKLDRRPRRRSRPVPAPEETAAAELESAPPAAEPESPVPAGATGPTEPAAATPRTDDLPAVPHPSLMPARPGTPPPPPGPPGTYVEPRPVRPRSNAQLTFGIVLVVFGVLALLNTFGLLWWVDGRLIWPVVLIAAGLILLYRRGWR